MTFVMFWNKPAGKQGKRGDVLINLHDQCKIIPDVVSYIMFTVSHTVGSQSHCVAK